MLDNNKKETQGTTNYSHKRGFRSVTTRLSWKQRGVNVTYTKTNKIHTSQNVQDSMQVEQLTISTVCLVTLCILVFILKQCIAPMTSTALLQNCFIHLFAMKTNAVKSAQLVLNPETFIDKRFGNVMRSL